MIINCAFNCSSLLSSLWSIINRFLFSFSLERPTINFSTNDILSFWNLSFLPDAISVKVVALHVPSSVRKGAEVELACLYELGNSSLYSLKWFYRANETDLDEQEFFRYTPTIVPHKQYFPLEGINVNVSWRVVCSIFSSL